jgi:hypothetical protein
MDYIRDLRLWLFTLLALLASIISAHGAWVFFGYLVEPWLAGIFTAVVALGIIGLDAAATVERHRWRRAAYIGGMSLFLAMEVLANYFTGQASFVAKVRAALADSPGADLLTVTTNYPWATRGLVVLFLSLASIAVAAFVFAAASRVQLLTRSQLLRVLPAQRRALIKRIVRLLRAARAELVELRGEIERLHVETVELRAQAVAASHEAATQRAQAADAASQRDQAADVATRLRGETERLRAELAQARAAAARPSAPVVPSRAMVVAYAQQAVGKGRGIAEVARELGFSESTLRDWVKAASNGHSVESAAHP